MSFHFGNFVKHVVHEAKHEVKKIEHGLKPIEKAAKKTAAKVSHVLSDAERQAEIDAFLFPVQHRSLHHSPACSRLKAILEYRSKHGQSPIHFLAEMVGRSKTMMQHHGHDLQFASNFLRAATQGNNAHRLKQEVLTPVRAGSISSTEAWNRANSITGVRATGSASPGCTVGVGGSVGGSLVFGAAALVELIIGGGPFMVGTYAGVEVSEGVQAGVNADIVIEVGFVSPQNFGGPYWGIGIGGALNVGGILQVTWSLPASGFSQFPDVHGSFQGFAIGGGIGEELEAAWFVGDGFVQNLTLAKMASTPAGRGGPPLTA